MNVFSPMQGMNAFAQGANIGGNIRQQETQSKLAPLVANGQYQQAAQVAGERGDLGGAEMYRAQYQGQLAQMGEQEKVAAAKRAEDLGRVAVGLKGVPYEQRQAMLQQQLPMLQAMGMDPQQIQGFDPNDQNLDAVLAQVTPLQDLLKGPEQYTLGENQVRYDEQGNVIARGMEKARDPINVNGVLVDPVTYEPVGNYQTPSQSGQMTDYQRQQLAIERQQAEQARAGRWQSAGDGVIFNTGTGDMQGGGGFDYGATGTFDANTGMGGSPFQTIEMYDPQGRVYQADFSGPAFGGSEGFTPPQPSGRKPTDFDKTQDREMAKDIADWKTTGQATALTSLAKLRDVIADLEDPNSRRGGSYMAMLPDGMKPLVAPNSVDAKETAESVVQSSLKAVLGGQFAQKEADQLFARTYNPVLGDEVNAKRLQRLYNEMVNRAAMNEAASRYADQYGTLQGFEGYLPQLQDFMLTDAETTTGSDDMFGSGGQRPRRSRGDGGGNQYEQTATNPQTGERMGLRNGQWEPIQ